MVSAPLTAAIAAIAPLARGSGVLLASAFTTSQFSPVAQRPSSSWALCAGKGFGEKIPTKQKSSPPPPSETETPSATAAEDYTPRTPEVNTGSKLLRELRSREAEKRDEELRKVRELRETDALLKEDAGAAAIPERVAQRMGKRMLPFVGIPLFGSFASFIGFWYLATFKDMEFQPSVVATTSFAFLAIGLLVSPFCGDISLVLMILASHSSCCSPNYHGTQNTISGQGITYSVMSASWDDDREGSGLGVDEFQKNVESLKDGLSRTKGKGDEQFLH